MSKENNLPLNDGLRMTVKVSRSLRKKPIVSTIIIAIAVLLAIIAIPLPPMNQTITVVFDRNLSSEASGVVVAGMRDGVIESKTQRLTITTRYASYHPDPLTYKAETIRFRFSDIGSASIIRVDGEVNSQGRHWWTVHRILANDIKINVEANAVSFVLNQHEMQNMVRGWKMLNPFRLVLLMLELTIVAIVVLRKSVFSTIPQRWFLSGVIVVALTCMGAWRVWEMNAPLRSRVSIITILFAFLILTSLNVVIDGASSHRTILIVFNYVAALVTALGQGLLYIFKWSSSPDEIAHLSYVAWEKIHLQLVPDFAHMGLYGTVFKGYADLNAPVGFNQLGHPPLYYLIMCLVPGMQVSDSSVTYHLGWLRLTSLAILLLGLMLCAYLLYSRMPHIPILHLVAALGLVACPNMVQVSAGVNNDSLCLLTVTVTIWGILRLIERKYDWRTFLLIMFGISSTLLTKLTAGMIVSLVCLFTLISIVMDRQARAVLRKRSLWFSSSILILPIAYYMTIILRYHSVQPSYQKLNPTGYISSTFYSSIEERYDWNILQYLDYYITQFLRTWWSMPWQDEVPRTGVTSFTVGTIALTLLWLIPFAILFTRRSSRDAFAGVLFKGMVAIVITMVYQFNMALNAFYVNGYTGGLQSRYYLCAVLIIIYSLCWVLQRWFIISKDNKQYTMSYFGTLFCVGFSMLLVWDGLLQPFLLQPVGLAALG
ncbi:glycosyltransferase family 39 protein [Bifidobacterium sp. SO4]|uniref:glycosyltransferase family 39 protein n=1 Tax=Bifidobacterium sp. SO4 TaxID=2809030 RepID=UPI001BDC4869|nr:glycosyltransferase family 39 protein [Bifidobacterium sp. SO4]MBT1170591.1 glycosyltransferase family 39 protein [Bifidobacterium sp. SO4]